MFLLTAFNLIIMALLIAYVFYRLIKTKSIFTLISFTLQLSALTIVLLSVLNGVQTSNAVEVFYIASGIVLPCSFIAFDYRSMIKKIKEKGSYEGLIVVDRINKEIDENSSEIMSVISNDSFVDETIAELNLFKDDLFRGIKKKLVQAESFYNENNFDDAYDIYSSLITLFGSSANLYFNYGNICFKKGLLSEAQAYYRKVLELNAQLINNLKKSSGRDAESNNPAKNIEFKQYLVYFNIGVTYLNMGKLDFAMEYFEKSLEINPSFDIAKEGIGRVFAGRGEKQEAVRYYEDVLKNNENNYGILFLLGKMFVELDRPEQAEECYKKCVKISPNSHEAYTEYGKILMHLKNYQEAAKAFKTCIGINKDDSNSHYHLAGCYYQLKEYNKAGLEYEKALELNPGSYNSVFNLGFIHEEKGDTDKAIEYYKAAIVKKLDFVDAYNNLGILFSKQQRHIEAIATYTSGIKACKDNYSLYYNMGIVLFELRRYEDAADVFKRAVEINSKDTDIYYYLGASLTESKKYDEAIKAYSKALNEDMGESEIYYNIASVYALMKKQDIAIDNLKKAIDINPNIKKEIYLNNVFDYMHVNSEFTQLIS